MSPKLRVAVVQYGSCPEDRDLALAELLALFERAAEPGVDVVVFPELATTPYFCATGDGEYRGWAETVPGPSTEVFAAAARRLGTGVIFGMYEKAGDGMLYNSAVVIDRFGALVPGTDLHGTVVPTYRKSSIPKNRLSTADIDEKQFFDAGTGPVLFEAFGTRFSMVICYDRTFPEYWLAARALGAELVFALVSSLGERETLFVQELQVRAMETQVWVVAPNRGGVESIGDRTQSYFGLSCVITPTGEVVAQAPAHTNPEILTTRLDLDAVEAARVGFPLNRDRLPTVFRYLADAHSPDADADASSLGADAPSLDRVAV